jgi:F-type H+-transporting ATPase subunit gamma
VAGFKDGEYDEVYVVFNTFVNAITQDPTFRKVLPLKVEESADESSGGVDYLYEPSAKELISTLLPLYLQTLVLQAFLDTEAGELAARMTAMDSATNNASDLIDRLTLEYNRARQAAITTEITEIVSGAEAL